MWNVRLRDYQYPSSQRSDSPRPLTCCLSHLESASSLRWAVMTYYNGNYPAERASSRPQVPSFENSSQRDSPPSQQLSSASSYADLQYLFGVQDTMMDTPKPNRNRRKSNPNPDQTKHRRTRSGCYTCRSRRVKVCEDSVCITSRY